MGRKGTAAGEHGPEPTHSRGNMGLPSFGVQPVLNPDGSPKLVRGRSGEFPVYRNWLDGLVATLGRLTAADWYCRGRTIGQVFLGTDTDKEHVWAPAGALTAFSARCSIL